MQRAISQAKIGGIIMARAHARAHAPHVHDWNDERVCTSCGANAAKYFG